eukprot:UN09647
MELYQLSYDPQHTNWTWGIIDFTPHEFPAITKWLYAIRDAIVIPNADIYDTHVAGFAQFVGEKINNQHKLAFLAAQQQQTEQTQVASADNDKDAKVDA